MPTNLKDNFIANQAPGLDWGNGVGAALNNLTREVYMPEEFGAKGDGATDDTIALQMMFSEAELAPASIMSFSTGAKYLVTDRLTMLANNSYLYGPGASIINGGSGDLMWIGNGQHFARDLTYFPFANGPYLIGATSIELLNVADASNFSIGDYVYVRARQTISDGVRVDQPIAELNKVRSIDGAIITLEWPLTKDYIEDVEFPFGIANANSLTFENVVLDGLRLDSFQGRSIWARHLNNLEIKNCQINGLQAPVTRGKNIRIHNNDINLNPNWSSGQRPYYLAPDTGTSDVWFYNNRCNSREFGWVHLLEGQSNIWVYNNLFLQGQALDLDAEQHELVRISSLGWNVNFLHNIIVNNPGTTGIGVFASVEYSEGVKSVSIVGNKFYGVMPEDAIQISNLEDECTILYNDIFANCGRDGIRVGAAAPSPAHIIAFNDLRNNTLTVTVPNAEIVANNRNVGV